MHFSIQQCSTGCLKCLASSTSSNPTGICQLCDISSNFVVSGTGCVVTTLTNCSLVSATGACLVCNSNFYLNTSNGACVAVPSSSQLSNCSAYGTNGSCASCSSGYYILNNSCTQITNTIASCSTYMTASTCSGCASGFFLASDSKSCMTSNISNCIRYSPFNCFSCVPGYFYNENQSQFAFQNSGGLLQNNVDLSKSGNLGTYGQIGYGQKLVCQQNTVTNCKTWTNFNACETCNTGSYLDSFGSCIVFPSPVIPNCYLYSSLTTCTSCNQGFFLASSSQCTAVTLISNCTSYSQIANSSQCSTCASTHYLVSNVCNIRTNASILNCLTYDTKADNCLACVTSFTVTSDKKACLPVVANCLTYNSSTTSTTALVCNACSDLYYLSGATCTLGTVTNCKTYTQSLVNTCSTCVNQYYLSSNQCILHLTISNCMTYSNSVANTCSECSTNSVLFTINNICASSTTNLVGCSKYATASTCSTCLSGYYLNSGGCSKVILSNCVDSDATNCFKCTSGYMLQTSDKKCYLPHDFQKENCDVLLNATSGYDGSRQFSPFACSSCSAGSYEVDMANQAVCVKDDQRTLVSASFVVDANCQVYNGTTGKCLICKSGYFPDGTPSICTTTCASNLFISSTNTSVQRKYGSCEGAAGTFGTAFVDCALVGPSVNPTNDNFGGACFKCKYNMSFISIIDGTFLDWTNPSFTLSNTSQPTSPVARQMTGKCTTAAGTTITNCLIHITGAITSCYKCKWGYYAVLAASDASTTCVQDTNCDPAPPSDGIELAWVGAITCVKCIDGKMPLYSVIGIAGTSVGGKWLTIDQVCETPLAATQPGTAPTASRSYQCSDNRTWLDKCLVHNLVAAEQATKCGLNHIEFLKTNVSCAVCSQGYKKDTPLANGAIGKCTKIANCDLTVPVNTQWYNNCSKCISTWVHPVTSSLDGGVDYTSCAQSNTVANCLASNSATLCIYCEKGYTLTSTSSCDIIDSPKCANGATTFSQKIGTGLTSVTTFPGTIADADLQKSNLISTHYYLTPGIYGCSSCNSGYTPFVNVAAVLPVCVKSTRGKPIPTIPNCSNYIRTSDVSDAKATNANGFTLKCVTCANGYIINNQGTGCIAQSVIPNCLVTEYNNNSCVTCNTGYSLVSGACQVQSISNCSIYVALDSSAQTCQGCSDGYYLSNNSCIQGAITNCAKYSSANVCSTCLSGFTLLNTVNTGYYCIAFDSTMNCSVYDPSTISNGNASCTSCSGVNYYITSTTGVKSGCWPLNTIPNCATYNIQTSIVNSSYLCTACATGYYLSASSACVQRVYLPANCLTYSPNSDTCLTCSNNSFVATNGQTCVNFPTGIPFCSNYTNGMTCNQCSSPYYLNSNACSLVNPSIPNCNLYQSNTVCIGCTTGFAAISGSCVQATATNCLTYSSASVCATCPASYGFQSVSGSVNCVPLTDSNCSESGNVSPFVCTKCKVNFYPNVSGICTSVTVSILNCLTYVSPTTCSSCAYGTILSLAKTACTATTAEVALLEPQCKTAAYLNSPYCSACSLGFYFSGGTCVPCPAINGCKACNPLNTAQCHICASGYYQLPDFSCSTTGVPNNGTLANLTSWTLNSSDYSNPFNRNLNYTDFVGSSEIMGLLLMISTVLML